MVASVLFGLDIDLSHCVSRNHGLPCQRHVHTFCSRPPSGWAQLDAGFVGGFRRIFAKQALKEQLQLASSDSLTGALNRRYLTSQLETRRADFVRNQRVSSLVLIDVDGLKALNDRFGHKTGDQVLKAVVDITLQRIRGSDSLFRIGGDEFALILADAKSHDALTVSNDIRRLLREHVSSDRPPFSVSFGVCCVDETASSDDWLARADEALYEAKRGGGDVARMAA